MNSLNYKSLAVSCDKPAQECKPTEQPKTLSFLDKQEELISLLHDQIDRLNSKSQAIQRDVPCDPCSPATPAPPMNKVFERIDRNNRGIDAAIRDLESIMSRFEI